MKMTKVWKQKYKTEFVPGLSFICSALSKHTNQNMSCSEKWEDHNRIKMTRLSHKSEEKNRFCSTEAIFSSHLTELSPISNIRQQHGIVISYNFLLFVFVCCTVNGHKFSETCSKLTPNFMFLVVFVKTKK